MNSRIAHHATLAHFIRARLELWFDKREQTPPRPDKAERYIQHFGKRNEACVTYRDVDRPGNKLGAQMPGVGPLKDNHARSEEHTSELQSLMRISYAVFCLKKTKKHKLT